MNLNLGVMLLYAFLLGLLVGSFLNVCIYRIPKDESIVFPSSHCTSCQHKLQAKDLIPLFSYLFLGGKCRYCGEKIPWRYPLVELINGLGWVLIMWHYQGMITVQSIAGMLLFSFSLVLTLIDIKHYLIPNCLVVVLLVGGIIYHLWLREISIGLLLLGLAVGFAFPFVIAVVSGGGMGGGDIKLCAAMGLWLGYPSIIYALFIGALLGSLVGIMLIICRIKTRKDRIPFGPFLMLGFLAMIFFQKQIVFWYLTIIS
jgi:leader peptidase (prepilin peptidase)/N-methyltransferase